MEKIVVATNTREVKTAVMATRKVVDVAARRFIQIT
jgi:hypothetical protein